MALPIFQRTVTNSAGDVIEGAQVSVFDESTGLPSTIYSNREGTAALPNPFLTGSDGLASFYAQQGEYRISVSSVAGSVTWRYQPLIGTLDEGAAVLQAGIYAQNALASANAAIDARDVAIGAANYKGPWEGKTSSGSIGDSYSYDGAYIYALNVNLANISTSEPSSTNTDYQLINEIPFEPSVKPTMVLDFANENFEIYDGFGTGFVKKPLNNIVTHTRASSATGVDPIGRVGTVGTNIPRLVFEDGVAKGYLSEKARTNLLTNSEFPNGLSDAPLRAGLVTLDTMDYGDGSVNAIAFGYDGATNSYAVKSNYTGVIGTNYYFSVFVETDDGLPPSFNSSDPLSSLNDLALIVNQSTVSPTGYTIKKQAGDVYKVSAKIENAQTSGAQNGVRKYSTNSPRTFKVTGYQLEVGSFPTSYIKTQASTVTRSSDSMVRTLGDEWNPNEGTFVVEFGGSQINKTGLIYPYVFSIRDGVNSVLYLLKDAASTQSNTTYTLRAGTLPTHSEITNIPSDSVKFTIRYGGGSLMISTNGRASQTTVFNDAVNSNLLGILCRSDNLTNPLNTSIKSLTYYPKALPANELQELSRL